MMGAPLVIGFPEYELPARRLAKAMGADFKLLQIHRFPDGESLLRFGTDQLPRQVLFCRSLDHPNDKLVELVLAAQTAKELGAQQLTLVAPYLCYMRQDIAFQPGEAVSQRIVGPWLAGLFDRIITVDPHLHRISSLSQIMPNCEAITLSATRVLGEFLKQQLDQALLLGPDEESSQWVHQIAEVCGFDYAVAKKLRLGDRQVEVTLPAQDYTGNTVVLVDDMVSTGHTLAETARQLKVAGAVEVNALFTHALFDEATTGMLQQSGISTLWSSDSVLHATNQVHLAPLIARYLL